MGWKGELGQQRTAQNTRCQRLALFFPPRGGRYNFSVPAANAEARVWPGRGTGRRAHRVPSTKTPAAAKGSPKRRNGTESAPRSPNKKPRRMGGVLFAKESYYLVVMNTPGPMVELKEMLFT